MSINDAASQVKATDKRFYSNGLSRNKVQKPILFASIQDSQESIYATPRSPSSQNIDVDLAAMDSSTSSTTTSLPTRRGLLFEGPGHSLETALGVCDQSTNGKTVASPAAAKMPAQNPTTPATNLVHRTRKRAFKQSRNPQNSTPERKQYCSVTVFTQSKFAIARELAQLEIENEAETQEAENNDVEVEEKPLSQSFLETLTEYHTDYN